MQLTCGFRRNRHIYFGNTYNAIVSTLAALLISGCSNSAKPVAESKHDHGDEHHEPAAEITNRISIPEQVRRNLGITFAKVEMRRIASTLRMPGRFELTPSARRVYSAPLGGRVELLVHQYDKVSTGTPLFRLDSADWRKLQQEISDAQAVVKTTSASLVIAQAASSGAFSAANLVGRRVAAGARHIDSLRQSLKVTEARLTQLENLQRAVGGKLSDLADARAKAAEIRAAITQAEEESADAERETMRQASEGGSVFATSATLEAGLHAKRAEHDAALMRLRVALSSAASVLGVARDEIDRPTGTDSSKMPLWQATDSIEVRAISSGVVQTFDATGGAYVEATKPILTIADPEQVRFRAVGLQSDLERLRDGMEARIVPPAAEAAHPADRGHAHTDIAGILSLGQEADPDQRSLDVIISLRTRAHWALPGVAAYAEAVSDQGEDPAAAIPVGAILQDDLQKIFFRRDPEDPDKAIRMEADLGISDGNWVAVESGIKSGDEVVLGGAYQLKLAGGGKASKAGHFHADGTFHEGKD